MNESEEYGSEFGCDVTRNVETLWADMTDHPEDRGV